MAQKTCYVKCVSNEQAQQLRGELVKVGFVDLKDWNDIQRLNTYDCIQLFFSHKMAIYQKHTASSDGDKCIYTLTPDENLTEAAVKIKGLFDNQ